MTNGRRWISVARTKTISSIEAELAKVEADLSKAQARVDALTAKLLDLQKQKQEYESRQIMDAYRKSGKTFEELMTFLNV